MHAGDLVLQNSFVLFHMMRRKLTLKSTYRLEHKPRLSNVSTERIRFTTRRKEDEKEKETKGGKKEEDAPPQHAVDPRGVHILDVPPSSGKGRTDEPRVETYLSFFRLFLVYCCLG